MPSYREVFVGDARRLSTALSIDLEAWIERLLASGMDPEEVTNAILDDLLSERGRRFGPFFRQLSTAASDAVNTAASQGELLGEALEDADLRRLLARRQIDGPVLGKVIDDADPDAADAIESELADHIEETMIAALRNSCEFCVAAHGTTMTRAERRRRGLMPGVIHDRNGISSPCYCRLVPKRVVDTKGLVDPLRRVSTDKKSGLSKRQITSDNFDKADAARAELSQSLEGRRALRKLGESGS